MRAERRLGEMIRDQKETVGLHEGGRPLKTPANSEEVIRPLTLKEAGIDHKLSSRAQKLAAVPAAKFEGMIGEWRGRVEKKNERATYLIVQEPFPELEPHPSAQLALALSVVSPPLLVSQDTLFAVPPDGTDVLHDPSGTETV